MSDVHIYKPRPTGVSYRLLAKRCRIFDPDRFSSWDTALWSGIERYQQGFRVYEQRTYEWYEPINIELIKVTQDLKKVATHG